MKRMKNTRKNRILKVRNPIARVLLSDPAFRKKVGKKSGSLRHLRDDARDKDRHD